MSKLLDELDYKDEFTDKVTPMAIEHILEIEEMCIDCTTLFKKGEPRVIFEESITCLNCYNYMTQ